MPRQGVGVNAIGDAGPAVLELLVGEDVVLLARRNVRRAYVVVLASAMMSSTMSSMGRGPRAVRGAEVRRRSLPLQACRYITRRSCQDRGGPWLTAALELVTRLCAYIPTARPHGPPRGAERPKAAMTQPCSSGLGQSLPKQNCSYGPPFGVCHRVSYDTSAKSVWETVICVLDPNPES